jgi:isoamylase
MIQLRKSHSSLRQNKFADLALDQGGDVTFFFKTEDGESDLKGTEDCIHWRIDGSGIGCEDFLVLINMHAEKIDFIIPPAAPNKKWLRLIDTAAWAEPIGNYWPSEKADTMGSNYIVNARSVVVLKEAPLAV